jgi:hypothetical protein
MELPVAGTVSANCHRQRAALPAAHHDPRLVHPGAVELTALDAACSKRRSRGSTTVSLAVTCGAKGR